LDRKLNSTLIQMRDQPLKIPTGDYYKTGRVVLNLVEEAHRQDS